MRVLAWPAESSNPYVAELYQTATELDPALDVIDFRPATAWRTKADVIHVHWPEIAPQSPSLPRAVTKSVLVLATLAVNRLRGGAAVWTSHNLQAHEERHPRLGRWYRQAFDRLIDGVIHLSEQSQQAMADHPRLGSKPSAVAPHGRYRAAADPLPSRAEARAELGLDPDGTVLASVGFIRPYKQIPGLIAALADMSVEATLLVAGEPQDAEIEAEVRAAAAGVDGVVLDDRWLTEAELATRIRAADAVVLGYREVNNSGVAILALGLGRPVAVTPAGAMLGLADAVGPDWVASVEVPLTGAQLDRLAVWAAAAREGEPDLSAFSPDLAAERTLEFYRSVAR